jgi:hypothetical protein
MSSIQSQHQSAIDEVKASLDMTNPINEILDKLDDPTEDAEFLTYWLNQQKIPSMTQVIDKPTDVSKIRKAHISQKTKDEAISWKCDKAAEKVIWINRKRFSDVTKLGKKLIDFLNDKYSNSLLILSNKIATLNPTEKTVGFLDSDNCRNIVLKNPTEKTVGFKMAVNVELNGNDTTFFPSTLLPEIFKTYSKKSESCMALALYYKATKDFTKSVLNIIEENFFLYMAERDYERGQYRETELNQTITRMEMLMIENKIDMSEMKTDIKEVKDINKRQEKKLDKVLENQNDPRFIIIYRRTNWPPQYYKVGGGLQSNRRFQKIINNKDEYEVISKLQHINNPAKVKKNAIESYKKKGIIRSTDIIDGDKKHRAIGMSDAALDKFIEDLKNIDHEYIPTLDNSDDEDDKLSFYTAQETIKIQYLVISRKKAKADGVYKMYMTLCNKPNSIEYSDYSVSEIVTYDPSIIDTIADTFKLVGDYYDDDDDGLLWYQTTIPTRTVVSKIMDFAKK